MISIKIQECIFPLIKEVGVGLIPSTVMELVRGTRRIKDQRHGVLEVFTIYTLEQQ